MTLIDEGVGMRIALGSGMVIFLVGMVFWAGATYNRIQGIESHLLSIDAAVSKIGDIQAIQERTNETQRRLDKLEESVYRIETDKKFGNR
jgi:hypothetical protein